MNLPIQWANSLATLEFSNCTSKVSRTLRKSLKSLVAQHNGGVDRTVIDWHNHLGQIADFHFLLTFFD